MRPGAKRPLLTIGMAYYRDWPGLWATIQSIRLHHQGALEHIEIVVIDNDPAGNPNDRSEDNHSFKARQLCEKIGAKYEHFITVAGTAAAKGRIFDLATGDWVLVLDCHVLLPTMSLDLFLNWIRQQPVDCRDLIHGPLIGDGGMDDLIGTHMRPAWGSLMYGQWAIDDRVHTSLEPFEIPMHGCGLFACRRDQWPGFHPLLKGFGPEEFHIHQRIRRNGGKIYCLPILSWCHRFGNPSGTRPPGLEPTARLRGHLITWLDTGEGDQAWFGECKRHFLESGMSEKVFAQTVVATQQEFNEALRLDCKDKAQSEAQSGEPQEEDVESSVTPSMPSMIIRGWNFTKAMAKWTAAGQPMRTQEEIAKRLAICQACPHLNKESSSCSVCGCTCVETNQVLNKLALATEKCPKGKWS